MAKSGWVFCSMVFFRKINRFGSGFEQGLQLAGRIEGMQIVTASHMGVADEDLRYGTPLGFLHHSTPPLVIHVHTNLLDLGDAPRLEQFFAANAVRAHCRAV